MSDSAPDLGSAVAVLYILSGVHLGARIELTRGSWLLGSDDECDLILTGLAPRHAELFVSDDDGKTLTCAVTPQQGPVFVNNAQAEGEIVLTAGEPWYLGDTCFAWNLPGVVQNAVVPQRIITPGTDAAAESDFAAGNDVETSESGAGESDAQLTDNGVKAPERETLTLDDSLDKSSAAFQPVRMDVPVPPRNSSLFQRLRRPVPLLLLALLLCALSFSFSTGPSRSEYPDIVSAILKKTGLTGLAVTPRWPGVEVRGAVATPSDLENLQNAVQEVSFPVYLEVAVDDDMIRAVRNAMGIRGFFPAVSMKRGTGEPHLLVAAFMRDTLVEADAFAQLDKDVPPPPAKQRRIVYEKDVAPLISQALQSLGYVDIQPVYLPGRVSLTGNLAPDRQPTLDRLKAGLSAKFGVPLFGEGVVDVSAKLPTAGRGAALTVSGRKEEKKEEHSARGRHMEDPLGGLKLTGVFAAPLDFITIDDGRCLFPGAVLPNGNVLEQITPSHLTLRHGNRVFTYSLRGNNE